MPNFERSQTPAPEVRPAWPIRRAATAHAAVGGKRWLSTRERAKTDPATHRRVPLSSAVVQLIREWNVRQQSEYHRATNGSRGTPLSDRGAGPVFTSTRGTRLEPRN